MADSPEQGLATPARLALADQPAPAGSEPAQLELADLLGLPVSSSIRPSVPDRRPGTRAGIRNKRTEEWLDYFSAQGYRLPIHNLMAYANLGVDELARRLGCTALEAMNVIIRCNAEAAPYLHAKLASIEIKRDGEVGGRSTTLAIDITPTPTSDTEHDTKS
jgi:hypothetical protein